MTLEPEYNLDEAASEIRMSSRWLRGRIKAGERGEGPFIEHQRYGHKYSFTESQIEKLRAQFTQAPVVQSVTTGRKKKAS